MQVSSRNRRTQVGRIGDFILPLQRYKNKKKTFAPRDHTQIMRCRITNLANSLCNFVFISQKHRHVYRDADPAAAVLVLDYFTISHTFPERLPFFYL
jgi:hypothetical protein